MLGIILQFLLSLVAIREHIKNNFKVYLYLCNKNIVLVNIFFAFQWLTLPCDQVHFFNCSTIVQRTIKCIVVRNNLSGDTV